MRFADYADDYVAHIERAIPLVGSRHDAFIKEKAEQLTQLAKLHFGNPKDVNILDVGCGVGLIERVLCGQFRNSVGVDVEPEVIEHARRTVPSADFFLFDGNTLPFPENAFDIVFAVCVFHHVNPERRQALAAEMARVTSRNGLVVIIEHNPIHPVTRLIVSRCEFDRDAMLLGFSESRTLLRSAGLERVQLKQILYVPWRTRFWKAIELLVSRLPFGTQYIVSAIKPAGLVSGTKLRS